MIDTEQMDTLFIEAQKIAVMAYAPYSNFRVGAALLCEDGTIVKGVNMENRSYGMTVCAERNAVAAAITMGKRSFLALAISTPDSIEPVGPCGACRQVISEFTAPDMQIRFAGSGKKQVNTTIGELLPFDSLHDLNKN
jgi:cytidine deaminase